LADPKGEVEKRFPGFPGSFAAAPVLFGLIQGATAKGRRNSPVRRQADGFNFSPRGLVLRISENEQPYFALFHIYRNIAIDMGTTKSHEFTTRENRLAKYAKALAHPARIAILHFLANQRSCMCGDIVEKLPLSQSTISQHLKELKEAGLITGSIEGAKVCYCIDERQWKTAQSALNQLFESLKGRMGC
jgi:DNA-binding transcriptional ArsR family regulator